MTNLEKIYDLIKAEYGNKTAVTIFANCEGINCEIQEKPFTVGYAMQTINGNWLPRKESL